MSELYHTSGENASGNRKEPDCILCGIEDTDYLASPRLSLKAKGLLSIMLARLPGWDYTVEGLMEINADGRDSVRAALAELEKAGYVIRKRIRDEKGHYSGNRYEIYPYGPPREVAK